VVCVIKNITVINDTFRVVRMTIESDASSCVTYDRQFDDFWCNCVVQMKVYRGFLENVNKMIFVKEIVIMFILRNYGNQLVKGFKIRQIKGTYSPHLIV
jgi:hypothetical protein